MSIYTASYDSDVTANDILEESKELWSLLLGIHASLSRGLNVDSLASRFLAVREHPLYLRIQSSLLPHDTYLRLMFQDLHSDYTYLVESGLITIELFNKKMALANHARNSKLQGVAQVISAKVLHLFILSRCDFRIASVQSFLQSCELAWDAPELHHARDIYRLLENHKLVPIDTFFDFISNRNKKWPCGYFWIVLHRLDHHVLRNNIIQRNISVLTRPCRNVSYRQLRESLGIDSSDALGDAKVDIEALLLDMIIRHQLPSNARLDQVQEALCFASDKRAGAEELDMNAEILHVGKLLGEICAKILVP